MAPENTMAAFELAYQQGAQAVELDVKLTLDGQIVAMHDSRVDRTTDGEGRVSELRLEEIRRLDAGAWKEDRFKNTPVPALDEILLGLADRLLFNIELTNYATPFDRLPAAVIELVRQLKLEQRVLMSSFNPWSLLRAHWMAPEIPLGLLVHSSQPRISRWLLSRMIAHQAWHPNEALIGSDGRVAKMHHQGRSVNVWTVNHKERMHELLAWGVDGIMTDHPPTLIRVVQERGNQV